MNSNSIGILFRPLTALATLALGLSLVTAAHAHDHDRACVRVGDREICKGETFTANYDGGTDYETGKISKMYSDGNVFVEWEKGSIPNRWYDRASFASIRFVNKVPCNAQGFCTGQRITVNYDGGTDYENGTVGDIYSDGNTYVNWDKGSIPNQWYSSYDFGNLRMVHEISSRATESEERGVKQVSFQADESAGAKPAIKAYRAIAL